MYCIIMMQRGGLRKERNIFNINKDIVEKTNELGKHKNKQRNERNTLKCMLARIRSNKFLKINKLQNPQRNTKSNKNVFTQHENISKFPLIPRSHHPQMTRWKYREMTNLIQVQDKKQPNQFFHLMNHPHFRINASMKMRKQP